MQLQIIIKRKLKFIKMQLQIIIKMQIENNFLKNNAN